MDDVVDIFDESSLRGSSKLDRENMNGINITVEAVLVGFYFHLCKHCGVIGIIFLNRKYGFRFKSERYKERPELYLSSATYL